MPNNRPHDHQPDDYRHIPLTDGFVGRLKEFQELETARARHTILVINGISGSGKTQLMAQYVKRYLPEYTTLWIKLNETSTWNDVLQQMRRFFFCTGGRESEAIYPDYVNDPETYDDPEAFQSDYSDVVGFLNSGKFAFCFDDYHKPDKTFSDKFDKFILATNQSPMTSVFIITTQVTPSFVKKSIRTFLSGKRGGLDGLAKNDALELIAELNIPGSGDQHEMIWTLTGGLPILIHIISGLIRNYRIPLTQILNDLKESQSSKAKIQIFSRFIFNVLNPEEIDALKIFSAFTEPITPTHLQFFKLNKRPDILNDLEDKYLVQGIRSQSNVVFQYRIHDLIKRLVFLQITPDERRSAHQQAVQYYQSMKPALSRYSYINALLYHYTQMRDFGELVGYFFIDNLDINFHTAYIFVQYLGILLNQTDLRLHPDHLKVFANKYSSAGVLLGLYSQTIRQIQAIHIHTTNCAETLRNLGYCFFKTGEYEKAITAYQAAIDLLPTDGGLLQELGNVYIKTGQRMKARALYEKAFAGITLLSEHSFRGRVLESMEQYDDALAEYELAVDENLDPDAYKKFNVCLSLNPNPTIARRFFGRLIQRYHKNEITSEQVIEFGFQHHLDDDVYMFLQTIKENIPDSQRPITSVMQFNRFFDVDKISHLYEPSFFEKTQTKRTILDYIYAPFNYSMFKQIKTNFRTSFQRVYLYAPSRFDEFEFCCFATQDIPYIKDTYHDWIKHGIDRPQSKISTKDIPVLYSYLARFHATLQEYSRGLDLCHECEAVYGESKYIYYQKASIYSRMKLYSYAFENIYKALAIDIYYVYADLLIELYVKTNQHQQAINWLQQEFSKNRDESASTKANVDHFANSLIKLYLMNQQHEQAIYWIQHEYSKNYDSYHTMKTLAEYYTSIRRFDEALAIYHELLKMKPGAEELLIAMNLLNYDNKKDDFLMELEWNTNSVAEKIYRTGEYYFSIRENEKGKEQIKRAIKFYNRNMPMFMHRLRFSAVDLIHCYLLLEAYDLALRFAEQTVKIYPFESYIRLGLSLCLIAVLRNQEALDQAKTAMANEFFDYEPILKERRWQPLFHLNGFPELLDQCINRDQNPAVASFAPASADNK